MTSRHFSRPFGRYAVAPTFTLTIIAALFAPGQATAAPVSNGCLPGTYFPSNLPPVLPDVCIQASPGSFVNTTGATAATLAPPGTFVSSVGASAASFAPLGRFVSSAGQTAATPAPAGTFVNSVGASSATDAPAGSYVSTSGASAPTLALPGTYVPSPGATSALLAPVGRFVSFAGATMAQQAPPGSFVNVTGSSAATLAPAGTFVSMAGQSMATLAPPGKFVDSVGQSAAQDAPAGSYVSIAGATAATQASPGTYVPVSGATLAFAAPVGMFVSVSGATSAESAPPGTFVDTAGSSAPTLAPVGFYTKTYGSAAASSCPVGTSSYGGSVACRSGPGTGPDTVSPLFASTFGAGGAVNLNTIALGASVSTAFDIWNASGALGRSDPLTDLTVFGYSFSGDDAALFSLDGFVGGVLHESDLQHLFLKIAATVAGPIDAILTFTTDQNAPLGATGQSFRFNLGGNISDVVSDVPEPGSLVLVLTALLGFGLNQYWRRRAPLNMQT